MERPVENIHVVVLKNFLRKNNVSLKGLAQSRRNSSQSKFSFCLCLKHLNHFEKALRNLAVLYLVKEVRRSYYFAFYFRAKEVLHEVSRYNSDAK